MKKVELIYDTGCPNVGAARRVLEDAFARLDATPGWVEWERRSPDSPAYVRRYGSPTILVDGRDATSEDLRQRGRPAGSHADPDEDLLASSAGHEEGGDSCRLYVDANGRVSGAPRLEQVLRALESPPR